MQLFYDQQQADLAKRVAAWDPVKIGEKFYADMLKWIVDKDVAEANDEPEPRKPSYPLHPAASKHLPSILYNAMIHPLIPYAVKGAIWYQGEANEGQHAKEYGLYFEQMIGAWRKAWGQGDFPLYWCQLAQYGKPSTEPIDYYGWVEVCDQQRRSLRIANTGMAVLNDIGEAKDPHPHDKMEASRRLALRALAKDYPSVVLKKGGKTADIVYSGPLYNSHKILDGKLIVTFESVGSGLMVGNKPIMKPAIPADGPLKRFQIAGADKKWRWAEAKIISENTVEVWHQEIAEPVAVRYAWASNAEGANLYNKEGLPASLFRTDDW